MIKNSQQIRNRGDLPQFDKNIHKNVQLTFYLMERN